MKPPRTEAKQSRAFADFFSAQSFANDEIKPQFTVRGKTFDTREAAAEYLADQKRMRAAETFMETVPWKGQNGDQKMAVRVIGHLIFSSPEKMAKALEIRCNPQAFATFVDELVLLRDGGF